MIVYICIYIKRDRETERQTERDRERQREMGNQDKSIDIMLSLIIEAFFMKPVIAHGAT